MLFLSNLQLSAKSLNFMNLKIIGLSSDRVLKVYLKLLISLHICRLTSGESISNFQCRTNPFKYLANPQTWECTKKTKADWQRLIYFTVLNCWVDKCTNLFQWVQPTMWKQLPPNLSATSCNSHAPCQSTPPCTAASCASGWGRHQVWPLQAHLCSSLACAGTSS